MSWNGAERDDSWRFLGRPGGDWQGLGPTFDNPMTWALPVGRVAGIVIRLHVVFLIFIIIELLRSTAALKDPEILLGPAVMATALLSLLLVVLLHELGHCIACRFVGGEADEILMWPLGGLAFCRPPHRWSPHLITALGGPAVNVLICAVCAPVLGLAGGRWLGVAVPDPLSPGRLIDASGNWPMLFLGLCNWLSLVLLLINLLPMFPLDGGRILQATLWRRLGYEGSMRVTVRIGFIVALLLGLWGAVIGNWLLVCVAVFGGVICFVTGRQLQYSDAFREGDLLENSLSDDVTDEIDPPPSRREQVRHRRTEEEAAEVDRILAKISNDGMDSLTAAERRLLKRTTERKRQE